MIMYQNWCQGPCIITNGEHKEDTKQVKVIGKNNKGSSVMYLCSNAIAKYEKQGFKVEELQG